MNENMYNSTFKIHTLQIRGIIENENARSTDDGNIDRLNNLLVTSREFCALSALRSFIWCRHPVHCSSGCLSFQFCCCGWRVLDAQKVSLTDIYVYTSRLINSLFGALFVGCSWRNAPFSIYSTSYSGWGIRGTRSRYLAFIIEVKPPRPGSCRENKCSGSHKQLHWGARGWIRRK